MTAGEKVRFVASAIFWCAVIFAIISLATQFSRDALIATAVAVAAGTVWVAQLIRDDVIRQRGLIAAVPTPVPVPFDDIEFDDELPWLPAADLRPHWDTDVMGAPE
ncbi:hypothetical protein BCA37_10580 [Mycobacterium sp. djl-10]|nr:hypothetical protein BCA37_10580 [Mycobacterium sp. djl-10]